MQVNINSITLPNNFSIINNHVSDQYLNIKNNEVVVTIPKSLIVQIYNYMQQQNDPTVSSIDSNFYVP